VTCTFDTRITRVKMHVSNCLTRVRHCTRVKLHVSKCMHFCSDWKKKLIIIIIRLIKLLQRRFLNFLNVKKNWTDQKLWRWKLCGTEFLNSAEKLDRPINNLIDRFFAYKYSAPDSKNSQTKLLLFLYLQEDLSVRKNVRKCLEEWILNIEVSMFFGKHSS